MDQMQNVLLTMMQAVSVPKVEQQREVSGENAEHSFRKLLDERTEQVSREENAQPKEESQTASETEKDELDEVQLQELAAMQMFCAANIQTVTVSEQEGQTVQGLTVPVEGAEAEVVAQELNQGGEQRGTQLSVEQTLQQEEVSTC